MKTAIYIENGLVQLVITPENDFEEAAIRSFEEQSAVAAEIFHGSFYDCRGGWTRQSAYYPPNLCGGNDENDRSLIIRTRPVTMPAPTQEQPE